jgi:serine protease AprX
MTNSISATWRKRFLVLMLLIAGTVFARAQNSKLSLDLQRMDSGKATDVIVQYYNDATADDVAAANAAGGKNGKALNSRAARFTMNPGQAKKLIAHSNVKYISPDRNLSGMKNYTAHIYATNTDDGWNSGYNGSGIGVAVIDSGVNSVGDLSGRVVYSQSFDPSNTTTSDLYGHGTHVAGIIAGNARLAR